jgi:hypothetical protein
MEQGGAISDHEATPCINVVIPDSTLNAMRYELTFGVVSIERVFDVVIESCAAQSLIVSGVTLEGAPELYFESEIDPFMLPGASEDSPEVLPSRVVPLYFLPTEVGDYESTLLIMSDDPAQSELRIPINVQSRSVRDSCPSARISEQSPLDVTPLSLIILDGSASFGFDAEDEPLTYEWLVIQRPSGSVGQVIERPYNPAIIEDGGESDDISTPRAMFFLDLYGEYVFKLVVTNSLGLSSLSDRCPQPDEETTLTVNVTPSESIYVTLSWSTQGDEDPTDLNLADVDLYFRHPNADKWGESAPDLWTCNYLNMNPDWGVIGPENDPHLHNNSPIANYERLFLKEPEFTHQTPMSSSYRVGVHYYSSMNSAGEQSDVGPLNATMRVYLGEEVIGTYQRELINPGDFWEVADITWTQDERSVTEVNTYFNMIP